MIKQTVSYTNFEGEEVKSTYYFNLTMAEIVDLETKGKGFSTRLRNIINEKDSRKIVEIVKEIILLSYGKRTEDGEFIKNTTVREAFASSEGYSALFMDLAFDENKLAAFVNGVMPKQMMEKVEMLKKHPELINKFQSGEDITQEDVEKSGLNVVENKN